MFWACIFLIFDSSDMGHFFHSPFLALFPSLPPFSLTPFLTFLTTKISSPLSLYFSTSAALPPYSPPPNFYPYVNKQASKQSTRMVSWPEEPFEVRVSFRWGRGGVRPRAAPPALVGSESNQNCWDCEAPARAQELPRGCGPENSLRELTAQRRHWTPAATGASARGRPGGAYKLQGRSRTRRS